MNRNYMKRLRIHKEQKGQLLAQIRRIRPDFSIKESELDKLWSGYWGASFNSSKQDKKSLQGTEEIERFRKIAGVIFPFYVCYGHVRGSIFGVHDHLEQIARLWVQDLPKGFGSKSKDKFTGNALMKRLRTVSKILKEITPEIGSVEFIDHRIRTAFDKESGSFLKLIEYMDIFSRSSKSRWAFEKGAYLNLVELLEPEEARRVVGLFFELLDKRIQLNGSAKKWKARVKLSSNVKVLDHEKFLLDYGLIGEEGFRTMKENSKSVKVFSDKSGQNLVRGSLK
jgi:hypothetical protein